MPKTKKGCAVTIFNSQKGPNLTKFQDWEKIHTKRKNLEPPDFNNSWLIPSVQCDHQSWWGVATAAHGQAPTAAAELVMINFEISRKPRVAAVTCHQQGAVLIATHLVGLSATNFTIINNNIYQHQGGRGVSVARRKNQKHRQMLCRMQLPIK